MNAGFDTFVRSEQLADSWLWERITVDLGYWVQSRKLQAALVEFQEWIKRIEKSTGVDLPQYCGYSPLNRKLTVFAGFDTDYASVPRIFWKLFDRKEIRRAAILHDALYRLLRWLWKQGLLSRSQRRLYRKLADDIFLEAMPYSVPPVPGWKIAAAYRSVRMFGWIGWSSNKKPINPPRPQRGPKHRTSRRR